MNIAIANQKGGVGKTTLTAHLAYALHHFHSRRVLAVDADPQSNLTSYMTDYEDDPPGSLLQLIVARASIDQVTVAGIAEFAGMPLLASNPQDTADLYTFLASAHKPDDTIARALTGTTHAYDYILIDCPPSRSPAFRQLLVAADYVLLPTQLERSAFEGINAMAETITSLQQQWGRPQLLGIIPNQVRPPTSLHRTMANQLAAELASATWPWVPNTIRFPEAAAQGLTIFNHDPHSPAAQTLLDICERLIATLERPA